MTSLPKRLYRVELKEGENVLDKCTGCSICEMACSLIHENMCNPSLSRLKIIKKDVEWVRGSSNHIFTDVICTQCGFCITVCPVDAIQRHSDYGSIVIDHEKCTKCQRCIEDCPFDALWFNKANEKVFGCDLCQSTRDREPICLKLCPPQVLKLTQVR